MSSPIYLNYITSISALGSTPLQVWENLKLQEPKFQLYEDTKVKVSALSESQNALLKQLSFENKRYNNLDKTALLAILAGRELIKKSHFSSKHIGINIGSSRGATSTFENAHKDFILNQQIPFATSPITTLGNVASNVAQDLGLQGPAISHSITCSSALHALLNAVAYLKSGMLTDFIIGGSEAPLTGFTIAQMKALKLYSKLQSDFPCRSLDFNKTENTLVLGEAACLASLSITPEKNAVEVCGIGYATEKLEHSVSLSADAKCLQDAMQMALHSAKLAQVDVVVMHAPGTIKGDLSEYKAIEKTFKTRPALTTNKWQIGHSFGASGAMSLEMAVLMIQHNQFIPNPFHKTESQSKNIKTVMVNAVGFGGNAVSVILKKL
jgi:3-oxoacyl-(acyl-carrier-protein) synthase